MPGFPGRGGLAGNQKYDLAKKRGAKTAVHLGRPVVRGSGLTLPGRSAPSVPKIGAMLPKRGSSAGANAARGRGQIEDRRGQTIRLRKGPGAPRTLRKPPIK